MAHAYTPGLRTAERTVLRKSRGLPIRGEVLVQVGDAVSPETVIARTDLPGKVHPLNVVNLLGIGPEEIAEFMLKKKGERATAGEPIAANKPLVRWFKTEVKAPVDGTVESISKVTGQVLYRELPTPLDLRAYVYGRVVEVAEGGGATVETEASLVQGIFGVGGETWGELAVVVSSPDEPLREEHLTAHCAGKIVVGGSHCAAATVRKAITLGVKGIVVGAVDDADLREILGYDLGVAITGTEEIGLTLILTEGFGSIPMAKRSFDLLTSKSGQRTSISGATQIRAGVLRPEIIIPLRDGQTSQPSDSAKGGSEGGLRAGDAIRVIREPLFGRVGVVKSLPNELRVIETGSRVRVLEVEFPDGSSAVVPRANVEIMES